MKQISVGMKFRLLGKVWRVYGIDNYEEGDLNAETVGNESAIRWPLAEADQLEWLEPEPTCSKEFADMMKEVLHDRFDGWAHKETVMDKLDAFIDLHTS